MTIWQWRYDEKDMYVGHIPLDDLYVDIYDGEVEYFDDVHIKFRRKPPGAPTRGREVSKALTEARTVLSRAQTAIKTLEAPWCVVEADPDRRDIIDALQDVVLLLSQYQRTGRPKKVS